jgi:hypothetical protein
MSRVLVILLCVAIFCVAAYFVVGLIPPPFQKWAIAVLVVIGAVFAINWLQGGGLGTPAA